MVIGYSLDGLDSTVTRLEIADAAAGAVALVMLVILGIPLVRVGLAPLARIERSAAAIAAGDLSQRIDHPSRRTEVGRLAERSTRCWAGSRRRTGRAPKGRRGRWTPRTGCGGSSPTPATSSGTPLTSVRGLAEFSLQQGEAASHTAAAPGDGPHPGRSRPDGPPRG